MIPMRVMYKSSILQQISNALRMTVFLRNNALGITMFLFFRTSYKIPPHGRGHDWRRLYQQCLESYINMYDSIVPDFGQIPIKHVTLDLLLMLPIKSVFRYLEYRGVDATRTPWRLISTLDEVFQLPVGTRVPFVILHNYLVVMLDYLHGLMSNEEDAYALMHVQYTMKSEPILTEQDASDFIEAQFPNEGHLLIQTTIHLATTTIHLQRAITFASSTRNARRKQRCTRNTRRNWICSFVT